MLLFHYLLRLNISDNNENVFWNPKHGRDDGDGDVVVGGGDDHLPAGRSGRCPRAGAVGEVVAGCIYSIYLFSC